MKRDEYYEQLHKKNLPTLAELVKRMKEGILKIVSITIDEPRFGHTRVTIFFRNEEK